MNSLAIYHRIPYPLKVAIASGRGVQLQRRRYGPETDRAVDEILSRDTWTAAQWKSWQEDQLARLLKRAATHVPYYRRLWTERRAAGDRASVEVLANWPVLDKEAVRENPSAFLADDCDPRRMFAAHTSGSSGKPLRLWQSRDTIRSWYALVEARWRRWYGVSRYDRWGIFGGQLVTPAARSHPPFWVWNAGMRQLYASSYHLAPRMIGHYVKALADHRIDYLWGYSSALYALAEQVLAQRLHTPRLKVAIVNAEPLYGFQRATITNAFRCPVRETYGMSEMAGAASECEHGRLHLWPDAGAVEVLDGDRAVAFGTTGDVVLTGLTNADMPLIRYRVGDRGTLASPASNCDCGRGLPLLAGIEGRIDDMIYTADGRCIGRLDPVFKADLPVRDAQIVQEGIGRFRVIFVPAPEFTSAHAGSIIDRLRQRLGSVRVDLESVERIPLGPNGKFRAVVSHVKPDEIAPVPR
jgi:phenylacetate-CoA ligase